MWVSAIWICNVLGTFRQKLLVFTLCLRGVSNRIIVNLSAFILLFPPFYLWEVKATSLIAEVDSFLPHDPAGWADRPFERGTGRSKSGEEGSGAREQEASRATLQVFSSLTSTEGGIYFCSHIHPFLCRSTLVSVTRRSLLNFKHLEIVLSGSVSSVCATYHA